MYNRWLTGIILVLFSSLMFKRLTRSRKYIGRYFSLKFLWLYGVLIMAIEKANTYNGIGFKRMISAIN